MRNSEQIFMETARTIASGSSCIRHHVGAVITTEDNRIIATGYNGTVKGAEHCKDALNEMLRKNLVIRCRSVSPINPVFEYIHLDLGDVEFRVQVPIELSTQKQLDYIYEQIIDQEYVKKWHSKWSEQNEVHAELNAILNTTRSVKDGIMYVTLSPCIQCAKAIVASGIQKVYFGGDFRKEKEDDGLWFLKKYIKIYKSDF